MTQLTIVSYNILCSASADTKTFVSTNENDLNADLRLIKLKEKFQNWMTENAIICLQEISRTWYLNLISFFSEQNYTLVYIGYSVPDSDYMGIGIAYPNKYKLVESKAVATHQFVNPVSYPIKSFITLLNKFQFSFIELLNYVLKTNWFLPKLPSTDELISKNPNVFLMLKFENNDKQFVVGNYHMPCWFDWRKIALFTISNVLVMKLKDFSKSSPFFLAGDFNSKPTDIAITFITKDENFLSSVIKDETQFTTTVFTSKKHNGKDGQEFKEQIDYIFYQPGLVNLVDGKILSESVETYIPNSNQPSDHYPIKAQFTIIE